MTRMSKQGERRHVSYKRPAPPSPKTGPLKDNLPAGYKKQINAVEADVKKSAFIPKIK
ncbi:MAG TPA: hypothetical protein VLG76_05150 [Rhabdochlamydiaceae bacterium]|nr:hypothetical protein [Rhabdochlamydiaceae bacterium]